MARESQHAVGLVLGSSLAPEAIAPAARQAEVLGFDEVWLAEDMFLTGGIAGAAMALAATERIAVGLGIVSAVVRHPALLAVELATVARAHPGRLTAGIGLGVPAWMEQMGLLPSSPLRAVGECLRRLRQLLAGETVTSEPGDHFEFDRVALAHTVPDGLPLHAGVSGPRMLELAGELADGTILSVGAGVEYLDFARRHIEVGRARAARRGPHRITQFALAAVDDDGDAARATARAVLGFYMFSGGANALTDAAGISDRVREMIASGAAVADLSGRMPADWIERLAVAGTPAEVAARVAAYHDAGADSVAVLPVPVGATSVDDTVSMLGAALRPG